ncbi:unnamed protein product, partial [Ectocarpus sp. 12 AP-2014]
SRRKFLLDPQPHVRLCVSASCLRVSLRCVSGVYSFSMIQPHTSFFGSACSTPTMMLLGLFHFSRAREVALAFAWARRIFRVFCFVAFSAGQGEWGGVRRHVGLLPTDARRYSVLYPVVEYKTSG